MNQPVEIEGPAKLRRYLRTVGKNQDEFGAEIQRDQSAVSRLVRGASVPDLALAFRMQIATGGIVRAEHFLDCEMRNELAQLPAPNPDRENAA